MRKNLSPEYNPWLALNSQWSEEAVDLRKTGIEIISYLKGLVRPLVKAMVTRDGRKQHPLAPPEGTCDHPTCVENGNTRHSRNECWERYPEKRPERFRKPVSRNPSPIK